MTRRIIRLATAEREQAIRACMENTLALARNAKHSIELAAKLVFDAVEDLGLGNGFLPDELPRVTNDLRGATIEVMCCDYTTELTVKA